MTVETARDSDRIASVDVRMQALIGRSELQAALENVTHRADALSERVTGLEARITSRLDLASGRSAGMSAGWGYLVGALAALSTLATLYLVVTNLRR